MCLNSRPVRLGHAAKFHGRFNNLHLTAFCAFQCQPIIKQSRICDVSFLTSVSCAVYKQTLTSHLHDSLRQCWQKRHYLRTLQGRDFETVVTSRAISKSPRTVGTIASRASEANYMPQALLWPVTPLIKSSSGLWRCVVLW